MLDEDKATINYEVEENVLLTCESTVAYVLRVTRPSAGMPRKPKPHTFATSLTLDFTESQTLYISPRCQIFEFLVSDGALSGSETRGTVYGTCCTEL